MFDVHRIEEGGFGLPLFLLWTPAICIRHMARTYKRILLKLSGESLMGNKSYGIDNERLATSMPRRSWPLHRAGVQVAVVIGGGNIYRGMQAEGNGHRSRAR
jgi:uridylate kinase